MHTISMFSDWAVERDFESIDWFQLPRNAKNDVHIPQPLTNLWTLTLLITPPLSYLSPTHLCYKANFSPVQTSILSNHSWFKLYVSSSSLASMISWSTFRAAPSHMPPDIEPASTWSAIKANA